MTPNPRVAVVIPVHNAEPFLAQTLDSVLAQTFEDWVAVVVDDASTDGSGAVAARYAAEHPGRFRLLAPERNLGVVRARNAAIAAAADCELVALLDHDDLLREDFLERMTGLLDAGRAAGRRVGIVGCDARLLGPGGYREQTWADRLGWYDPVTLDTLVRQNTIFARALFDRAAFEAVGGFAPETAGSDDHDLWLRLVQAGWEVAVTREPLAAYRVHAEAMSRNRAGMTTSNLVVYDRLLARGGLTASQRRDARRRVRHYRAVLAGWRARRAWGDGRRAEALRVAAGAAPVALMALAQDPRHWLTRRRRALAAGRSGPAAAR
jgi:glycosyltransferase involved in cell wall biosynthesis